MIINLKEDNHPSFRPMSLKGGIARYLDNLMAGNRLKIDAAIDVDGTKIDIKKINRAIYQTAMGLDMDIASRLINGSLTIYVKKRR